MKRDSKKMRVSFDLDEVLFVSPLTHKTEPQLPFPLKYFFPERLRLGTPDLISTLQQQGYEVWIYTSSFRSEDYIRRLFRAYGVRLDGIVNGERHLREVPRNFPTDTGFPCISTTRKSSVPPPASMGSGPTSSTPRTMTGHRRSSIGRTRSAGSNTSTEVSLCSCRIRFCDSVI